MGASSAEKDAGLRWLKNAEHWGGEWERFDERQEDLDPREVAFGRTGTGTGERESIWLLKSTSGPEARFYGVGKGQIGPRHKTVYAAICWAYGNGYLAVAPGGQYFSSDGRQVDPIFHQLASREEVLSGGMTDDKHAANGSRP